MPCTTLPMAQDGKLSTLMHNHVEVARLYHQCSQRHTDLVGVVRGIVDGSSHAQ